MQVRCQNAPNPLRSGRHAALGLCSLVLFCSFTPIVRARQRSVIIRVAADFPKRAVIEVVGAPSRIWSFRNSYAGVLELGSRIEGFRVFNAAGGEIPVRKIAPGQFETNTPATRFRYEVNLTPPIRVADAARVSWSNETRGLLMLADLLPLPDQEATRATFSGVGADRREPATQRLAVRLNLPDGWNIFSNEGQNASGDLEVTDADTSVFVIGKNLRTSRTTISGMTLNLMTDGEWAFADSEVLQMGADVLKAHREVFGSMPSTRASLILMPFPQIAAAEKWSAETRGSTVTLLLGRQPSKVAALAQLSVPLTHELFHLWVPNGLALDGDYDWFYEGFTIYQAARTGVRLGLLTFPDFLNAIGRAYDAYANGFDRDRWSLVEASQRRWTVGESVVYQKSMLVAFLYDLKLRSQTRDKHSLDDVYRELYRKHHSVAAESRTAEVEERSDGNQGVVSALSNASGMQNFADAFIRRPAPIDLAVELAPFGLRAERIGLRTHITVNETLTRQQRDLLRELGYNDRMRSAQRKHD